MAQSPGIPTELLVSQRLPAAAEGDVVAFFERFGTVSAPRRVRGHRGPALDWLVLAALPLQAFLQNLGTLTAGDAYGAFKHLIARTSHHEPHSHPPKKENSTIILQDSHSGIEIVLESGLPEIAFRQLMELDLAQFSSGPVRFDRVLGCWRKDTPDEAAT